ncbi:MAG: SDR family oxidoreductase [Patescibacteria group bacterium]
MSAKQKILVAGGAGYVGSRLVPKLLQEGHKVTVLDLLWFGNNLPKSVPVIKKDVFDIDVESLKGFDQVIFLAGLSNDPMAEFSPSQNFIYNGAAPAYLAYVAKLAGVGRFIYASSGSVYGFTDNKPLHEEDVATSLYPYGISKRKGEFGVMYFQDENFSVISLRKGTISGWSPRMRFDLIVNTMYMKAQTIGKITVNNPGIWRPILTIADAVDAYVLAVSAPLSVSGIFNISSGNFTVGEVGEKIRKHFAEKHGKKLEVEVKNVPDKRNYKVLIDKAKKILGFKPKGSIESILEELDENIGPKFSFSAEKYYNILVFKKNAQKKKSSRRK